MKELWLQYKNTEEFIKSEAVLQTILNGFAGDDPVVIYHRENRSIKRLPSQRNVCVQDELLEALVNLLGEKNVKVVEKKETCYEDLKESSETAGSRFCTEIEQLERIADALEQISAKLESIDGNLDALTDCIGFIPPMPYQERGSHFLRIAGRIDAD